MRFLIAAPLLVAVLSGCVSSDPVPVAEPTPWQELLSEPIFDAVTSSVHYIEAEDGTQLSLTVYLPVGLDEPAPTLLQLTPYQPLNFNSPATGTFAGRAWEDFVLRGAVYVEADARGTNGSEGCLDFGGSADRSDARVFTEWIRAQDWSNGVIVSDGVSHPGMGSVVAHVADPQLTASLAHAPVVSYYQDEWLQGAKFEDQLNGPLYQAIELAPALTGDPESVAAQAAPCTGATTLDYSQPEGRFNDLWQDRDLSLAVRELDAAPEAPILLTHGFVDINVHPDHSQLHYDALKDLGTDAWGIFGWWYHGWPDMEGHPAETFQDWRHRWLDATLFGTDNGLWDEPKILVEDSTGTWHKSNNWPIDGSETVTLYPDADNLVASASAAGEVAYLDNAETRRNDWVGSVAFSTEPLDAPRLVNGAPTLTLHATSTATQTKWVAYLFDEAPDGSRTRITHGYADSHIRAPQIDEWVDITPGQADTWTIPLQPTAVVVEEGHRLVLMITSQDSRRAGFATTDPCMEDFRGGCYNPSGILPAGSAGTAVNTIVTGPDATRVELAWVDPAITVKA